MSTAIVTHILEAQAAKDGIRASNPSMYAKGDVRSFVSQHYFHLGIIVEFDSDD